MFLWGHGSSCPRQQQDKTSPTLKNNENNNFAYAEPIELDWNTGTEQ